MNGIPPITILPIEPFAAMGKGQNPGIVPPWLTTPVPTPPAAPPATPDPGIVLPVIPPAFNLAPAPIVGDPDTPRIW
jgi:hypothetical protein